MGCTSGKSLAVDNKTLNLGVLEAVERMAGNPDFPLAFITVFLSSGILILFFDNSFDINEVWERSIGVYPMCFCILLKQVW